MDIEYPYADAAARRRLLYRLPSDSTAPRLLVVSDEAETDLNAGSWFQAVTVLAPVELDSAAAQHEARFDEVAMPWVLGVNSDSGSPRPSSAELLRSAHRILVPGGMVVGHVENARALRHLARGRALPRLTARVRRDGAIDSPVGCIAALLKAGFVEPECYYVQPSLESPMGLIPCEPRAARATFLRSVRATKGRHHRSAYVARLLVAALGLGGLLQAELFFWAKKPC